MTITLRRRLNCFITAAAVMYGTYEHSKDALQMGICGEPRAKPHTDPLNLRSAKLLWHSKQLLRQTDGERGDTADTRVFWIRTPMFCTCSWLRKTAKLQLKYKRVNCKAKANHSTRSSCHTVSYIVFPNLKCVFYKKEIHKTWECAKAIFLKSWSNSMVPLSFVAFGILTNVHVTLTSR